MVRDHLSMRYWPILINFDRFITVVGCAGQWLKGRLMNRGPRFFHPVGGVSMLLHIVKRDGFQLRCTFGII